MGKSKKKGGSSAVEDDFEVIEKTELLDDEATATEGQGSKKAAGKKGRKAKKEAELEEAQKELEALNDDPECEVPAAQTTTAKSGKKGTKKAKAVAKDDPSDHEDSDEGGGSGKSKVKNYIMLVQTFFYVGHRKSKTQSGFHVLFFLELVTSCFLSGEKRRVCTPDGR